MNKITKFITGLVLGLALTFSSLVPAQAQTTNLNYYKRYAVHLTSATTTTVISSDAYISSVVISTSAVGTAFKAQIQNKEGTAKILIPAIGTAAVGDQVLNFGGDRGGAAVYMKGGIDIVTTGTPGVIDVWITYMVP